MLHENTAIILLNWNGWPDTLDCLESVLDLESRNFSVIVCDNASSDDSCARIEKWISKLLPRRNARRTAAGLDEVRVELIWAVSNLGYAGGNNLGLSRALDAGADTFWVLNNDCQVAPDALEHLRGRMAEDPSIGLCGATLVYSALPDRIQTMGGGSFDRLRGRAAAIGFLSSPAVAVDRDAVEARLAYINGASTFITRAFLETVGLMDEDYFLYWEELDWVARARGRFRLGYAPRAIVRHRVGSSIGTSDFGAGSALSAYYLARNRLRFCWRHSRRSLPFVYLDLCQQILRQAGLGQLSRAWLLSRATLGLPFHHQLARRGPWQALTSRTSARSSAG